MSILRLIAIAGVWAALAFSPQLDAARAAAPASCSREEAIRAAIRACPGTPTSAVLGRNGRWTVKITEQNNSKWVVLVNNQTCRVVPMSMKRVAS